MRDVTRDLADCTTLRLGGPPGRLVEVTAEAQVPELARQAGDKLLVLAGGSNVVVSDDGYPGVVALLRTRGVTIRPDGGGTGADTVGADTVTMTVAAGERWDDVVALAVAEGWAGIECLSGVPGSAGATPIQNVSAYGQEVAETISRVRAYDRERDEMVVMSAAECGFDYRHSVFRGSSRWVVLEVTFRLRRSSQSGPLRYPEVTRALGLPAGEVAPLGEVRAAVLALRAGKGMVLDVDDPDTRSVGSFFINPVLDGADFAVLRERAGSEHPPAWPQDDGRVKTSAAWLIEHAGFAKGYGRDGVAISTKHTLALTNRGGGTTAALLGLAREIRDGVRARYGVQLFPEPVLVNCAL